MTFYSFIFKIFKANIKKYRLFIFGYSFAIAVLFSIISPLTANGSDLLYAPLVIAITFSVFFVVFSYNAFMKTRKPEFGNYMILGMTSRDVRILIIIESSIIFLLSYLFGVGFGIILSKTIILIDKNMLNISNYDISSISIKYTFNAFFYVFVLFLLIFTVVVTASLFSIGRYEITKLMKAPRYSEKNFFGKTLYMFIGIIMIVFSILYPRMVYKKYDTLPTLIASIICIIGIYFLLSNAASITEYILKPFRRKRFKGLIFISHLKYTFGRIKNMVLIVMLFQAIIIFFCMICVSYISDGKRIIVGNDPYDIAFPEFSDKSSLSVEELSQIMNSGDTKLVERNSIRFFINNSNFYISENDLNLLSENNFSVNQGQYIILREVLSDDGYIYGKSDQNILYMSNGNTSFKLTEQVEVDEVLFNNLFYRDYYVLSEQDFQKFSKNDESSTGIINLFKFIDWQKTGPIIEKLEAALKAHGNPEPLFVNSRVEDFKSLTKLWSFQFSLFIYVGALYFIASCLLIHFTLSQEVYKEKIQHRKLNKIGITADEARKILSTQLLLPFMLPIILAIFVSVNSCTTLFRYLENRSPVYIGVTITGIVYLVLQFAFYLVYRKVYIKKILYPHFS